MVFLIAVSYHSKVAKGPGSLGRALRAPNGTNGAIPLWF